MNLRSQKNIQTSLYQEMYIILHIWISNHRQIFNYHISGESLKIDK